MKYLILGTGGTGGCIGGFLANNAKNVTFIARGAHLEAIKEKGLVVHSFENGEIELKNVKAHSGDEEFEKVDVIFVCVKGYSMNEAIPVIRKAAHKNTIVIPILNTLSAGEKLGAALPDIIVLDGCIYISAYISAPGEITQGIKIFRLVFGPRENTKVDMNLLKKIQEDLAKSSIDGVLTDNIKCEIFKKFSFTSAYASTGAYYDVVAGEIKKEGKYREMFIALIKELQKVAEALNVKLSDSFIRDNLDILDGLTSDTTASLQKDIKAGKKDERDELIFDVVRIAHNYGVEVPNYSKISRNFGYEHDV
ncbi:2-dehydropantoate 2-reductase [Clostridium sp. PL3]|uniref:2-dehydropantoate 2-reductase n=1 Tax=Clostridium thailandense TaxID=2794346 RepID=A0A949TQB3_9CLOT|nr:2-dehydropantoate 2-reductase [Clostridium thailandense]MBV7273447.1 2-dehydropantoate 2-reductase [Clostridium thailandense]